MKGTLMDIDRVIGKLEEQGRHTEVRLNRIESKVDSLLQFKWRILGFAACAAFLATLAIEMARAAK